LVGDFTIVPGAILEAGTRLASAVRAEIDRDVAANRARAGAALEALVLALGPAQPIPAERSNSALDDQQAGLPPRPPAVLPWQAALLNAGASFEQELARRQERASAAFRAIEQEQLRISLLMQDTAGAAAMGGKTVLQRWLESAFGSKAEYEDYIQTMADSLCLLPGARTACVNVLKSLEPMRREAIAKRRATLVDAHRAASSESPKAGESPLAAGERAGAAGLLPRPESAASSIGAGGARGVRGAAVAPVAPGSPREPGPWEAPLLREGRPGSPGAASVVLERLPGMTDEDLERLNDFMGSDGTAAAMHARTRPWQP
jgi:hypothetical protein